MPDLSSLHEIKVGSHLFHVGKPEIRDVRKAVVGYSDVTSLLLFLQRACDLVVFHGPNIATARMLEYPEKTGSQASLHDHLFHSEFRPISGLTCLRGGMAQGEIVGGNLTRLVGSIGTDHEIETDQGILFLEDAGKDARQIDAMVTHLRNAGKLDGVRGMVFSDMFECSNLHMLWGSVSELLSEFGIPIASGLPSGHGRSCLTIPLGVEVILDAGEGSITFEREGQADVADR